MAKNNISTNDICNLMLCGSLAVISGAMGYALVKAVSIPCYTNANYNSSNKDNDDISSEYQNAVDFFDDFVDDCI